MRDFAKVGAGVAGKIHAGKNTLTLPAREERGAAGQPKRPLTPKTTPQNTARDLSAQAQEPSVAGLSRPDITPLSPRSDEEHYKLDVERPYRQATSPEQSVSPQEVPWEALQAQMREIVTEQRALRAEVQNVQMQLSGMQHQVSPTDFEAATSWPAVTMEPLS